MNITFVHNGFTIAEPYIEEYRKVVDMFDYKTANLHLMMHIIADENGVFSDDELKVASELGFPFPIDSDAVVFFQELYDSGVRAIDPTESSVMRIQ